MNKTYIITYKDLETGEKHYRSAPTREEAEIIANELFDEGYPVSPRIEEIKE